MARGDRLRLGLAALSVGLAAGGALTIWSGHPDWSLVIAGGVLAAALVFERRRYKPLETAPPPGFEATSERFADPATGALLTVYAHPATGERRYVRTPPSVETPFPTQRNRTK